MRREIVNCGRMMGGETLPSTVCGGTPQPLFGGYAVLTRRISKALVMRSSLFWRFGRKVAREFGFDFLDGGQIAAQFLGEGFGELGLPGGDGDG